MVASTGLAPIRRGSQTRRSKATTAFHGQRPLQQHSKTTTTISTTTSFPSPWLHSPRGPNRFAINNWLSAGQCGDGAERASERGYALRFELDREGKTRKWWCELSKGARSKCGMEPRTDDGQGKSPTALPPSVSQNEVGRD